jgi:hypothetical protein
MTSNFENIDLTIDLPAIQLGLVRGEKYYGPSRERVTGEKYFRQAIQIYNKEGKLVDSGFVQINDYTDMCRMVRVCNKSKKTFHLFERWEHYGSDFYKTTNFTITDLATGNTVGTVLDNYVQEFIKNLSPIFGEGCCYLVGDLEKDEYSTVLLECLNEYSNLNMPTKNSEFKKILEEKKEYCDCSILEELEIQDLFRNGEIDEERRILLVNSLICKCKNINISAPELTEEEQAKRAKLRIKAQSEIAEVLYMKEFETNAYNMV